ncbi:MAG: von Willebrand factor type [Chitinophagaceae bacterium]|nr:von Willebrand factor type [Chitinophagaceae bacterium]
MFRFQHIEFLYALAAIPFMVWFYFLLTRWKKNAMKKIGDPPLVKQLIQGFSSKLFAVKFILILFGFSLCAFAVADLVKPEGTQKINRKGIDVMIALDVSKSMLAEDIKPNRLERAKQLISKIIDKLSDDKVGIVVFAGRAYLQMPLTTDHSAAKMYLSSASTDNVPTQGTVISQALKMSYAAFNTKEKKYRSIILISDGEDHDEDAIKVTRSLADEGVMVNTVGIGSPQGAPIMDNETNEYKKDENGNTVVSKLNEEELKSIAQNGNGLYQLFSGADEVADNLHKKLMTIGQTTLTGSSFGVYKNYFWYFLLAAFVILLIESFLPEKTKMNALRKGLPLLFLILVTNISFSQSTKKEIIKGNDAYKKKEYTQAAGAYQNALKKSPDATAYYNLGNALYKTDKLDDALKSYDNTVQTAKTNPVKERAFYNGGVVLQKQNKLGECIKAYKNALKLDPNDEEARQNLQRALQQLKQQQKQDQQDKKQDKKDQQKEDQKKDEPKPQPSKISKQDAEEKLKSLLEHEKDLQDKLHKVKANSTDKPKKDW